MASCFLTVKITLLLMSTYHIVLTAGGPLKSSDSVGVSLSSSGSAEDSIPDCHEHQDATRVSAMERDFASTERHVADCRNCARRKANVSSEELAALRLEIVKYQILQKLQMTRPPCPKSRKPPLRPLLEAAGMMESESSEEEQEDSVETVSRRAKSIVLYPADEHLDCLETEDFPCNRFRYRLPNGVEVSDPVSAEIWFYKTELDNLLKITELVFDPDELSLVTKRDIAAEVKTSPSHLSKVTLTSVTSWTEMDGSRVFEFQVSCYSGCASGASGPAVALDEEKKPFLIVNSANGRGSTRSRRSVDCVEGSTTCCRESLVVSFAEIGWDDWILAPESYEANFCKGKCVSDVSNNRYHHSTVVHRFIHSNTRAAEAMGLSMCCTPSKLSSLSILYQDDNGTIIKANLPDMKVEACDCA